MDGVYDSLLKSLYYNLASPLAFTSRWNIYREAKRRVPSIRKVDVDNWFDSQLAPTLHKPVRYRFKRNKTIVKGIGEQFQSDLCDVTNIKQFNSNYTFLVTCIDCFSRYAWVKPIKNKSASEMVRVLEEIFQEKTCKRLQTDKGKEFLNKNVKALLAKYDIQLWTTENEVKASLVERFNRTMKTRMYKYFTSKNTLRYDDILPQLVLGYNNTVHSSIGMAPAKVKHEDERQIRQKLYGAKTKGRWVKRSVKTYKYRLGDKVRISKAKRVFKKGYLPNWTDEIFTITSRTRRTVPIYSIEDFNGEQIKGTFYEQELQKINLPEDFRVERVIKSNKIGGKK